MQRNSTRMSLKFWTSCCWLWIFFYLGSRSVWIHSDGVVIGLVMISTVSITYTENQNIILDEVWLPNISWKCWCLILRVQMFWKKRQVWCPQTEHKIWNDSAAYLHWFVSLIIERYFWKASSPVRSLSDIENILIKTRYPKSILVPRERWRQKSTGTMHICE